MTEANSQAGNYRQSFPSYQISPQKKKKKLDAGFYYQPCNYASIIYGYRGGILLSISDLWHTTSPKSLATKETKSFQ